MASWNDVVGLLKSKYDHKETEHGIILLQKFNDGREQTILVFPKDVKGNIWADITSPVGVIKPEDLNAALEFTANCYCGGLVKFEELYAVRHCMPISDLSVDEIMGPLLVVASVADSLEAKFLGVDNI